MLKLFTTHRKRLFTAGLLVVVALITACADGIEPTPTLQPAPTVFATTTPIPAEVAKARVTELFQGQVAAIQRGDWATVYEACSPAFRAARSLQRYVRDASAQFERDGYTTQGFAARNIEPFVRASDRVRVRWDAYQDGSYVRTDEVGQTYIFTQGAWFDEGAWCR